MPQSGGIVGVGYGAGGSGGGLSQSQVDNRIAPWARTGEDRFVQFVDTLPSVADTETNVIYVRLSDQSEWVKEIVVTGISHREAPPNTGLDLEGVFSSDLTSPNADDVYFNSATNRLRLWDGSAWSNRTVVQVFGTGAVGIGLGSGSPTPIEIDTIDEVVE